MHELRGVCVRSPRTVDIRSNYCEFVPLAGSHIARRWENLAIGTGNVCASNERWIEQRHGPWRISAIGQASGIAIVGCSNLADSQCGRSAGRTHESSSPQFAVWTGSQFGWCVIFAARPPSNPRRSATFIPEHSRLRRHSRKEREVVQFQVLSELFDGLKLNRSECLCCGFSSCTRVAPVEAAARKSISPLGYFRCGAMPAVRCSKWASTSRSGTALDSRWMLFFRLPRQPPATLDEH